MKNALAIAIWTLSLTLAAAAADWEVIFDGKDLSKVTTAGNWVVQPDGVLAMEPRQGESGWKRFASYLWFNGEYADFVCEFEYKHIAKGNSGLFFRIVDPANPVASGAEVQILDCFGKEKLGYHDLGGIIKLKKPEDGAPLRNAARPAGEWNQIRVTVQGSVVSVEINGQLVQDKRDLNALGLAGPALVPSGRIAIQDHGQPLWLRNIRIMKL